MRTGKARRIRAAVTAYAVTALFRGLPTYQPVRAARRSQLSVTGMIAFDELENRYFQRELKKHQARQQDPSQASFEEIITRNFTKGHQ